MLLTSFFNGILLERNYIIFLLFCWVFHVRIVLSELFFENLGRNINNFKSFMLYKAIKMESWKWKDVNNEWFD